MDIAIVFEWFAQESAFAAGLTHEQPEREIWTRLALLWGSPQLSVVMKPGGARRVASQMANGS